MKHKLTASKVFKEFLHHLHMAGHLFASHLFDTLVAIVDSENLFASQDSNANNKNVLADQHVATVKLASHGELATAHMGHEQYS